MIFATRIFVSGLENMFNIFEGSGIGSMPEKTLLFMHKYANSRQNYAGFYGNYLSSSSFVGLSRAWSLSHDRLLRGALEREVFRKTVSNPG